MTQVTPAQVGQILTASTGAWLNDPTSYGYQWNRSGVPITGAMFATYIPIDDDVGQTISVSVNAANAGGVSAPATSAPTSTVKNMVPDNISVPTISGIAQLGQMLTASTGTWTRHPVSFAYQWYRAGTVIAGATTASYVTVTADVGNVLTVSIIATNTGGSSAPAMSAPTVVAVGTGPILRVDLAMSVGTMPLSA